MGDPGYTSIIKLPILLGAYLGNGTGVSKVCLSKNLI